MREGKIVETNVNKFGFKKNLDSQASLLRLLLEAKAA